MNYRNGFQCQDIRIFTNFRVSIRVNRYLWFKKTIRRRWKKFGLSKLILVLWNAVMLENVGEKYMYLIIKSLNLSLLFFTIFLLNIENLGSLWFVSIIMLGYCIISLIKAIQKGAWKELMGMSYRIYYQINLVGIYIFYSFLHWLCNWS